MISDRWYPIHFSFFSIDLTSFNSSICTFLHPYQYFFFSSDLPECAFGRCALSPHYFLVMHQQLPPTMQVCMCRPIIPSPSLSLSLVLIYFILYVTTTTSTVYSAVALRRLDHPSSDPTLSLCIVKCLPPTHHLYPMYMYFQLFPKTLKPKQSLCRIASSTTFPLHIFLSVADSFIRTSLCII